jgi:hypothetical protein
VPVALRGRLRSFIGMKCIGYPGSFSDSLGIRKARLAVQLARGAGQSILRKIYPILIGHRYCTFGQKRYATARLQHKASAISASLGLRQSNESRASYEVDVTYNWIKCNLHDLIKLDALLLRIGLSALDPIDYKTPWKKESPRDSRRAVEWLGEIFEGASARPTGSE